QRGVAAAGPATTHGLERLARRLVDDERGTSAVGVDRAQAGGEPWQLPRRICRTVDGVEGDDDVAFGVVEARLLTEDAEPRPVEYSYCGLVGRQVAAVLAGTRARQAPILQVVEGGADGNS